MRFRYTFLLSFLILSSFIAKSQDFGIGQWRDQLPYLKCISVNEIDNRIWAATPYSLFYYDKDDNSVFRINKINGLSDIGISSINYSNEYKTLVVAYANANVDLIKGNRIINIPDIKRASILGNKTINTIYFIGKYAYLGCGFGIVVLDVDKEEIADTYYIGANGGQVNVLSITLGDNDTIYAGSDKGMYVAYSKNPNLANFQAWQKDTRLNLNNYFGHAVTFYGDIVVSTHYGLQSQYDTLYRLRNGSWTPWIMDNNNPVTNLRVSYNKLLVVKNYFLTIHDSTYNTLWGAWNYGFNNPFPLDGILDKNGVNWIGDNVSGLVKNDLSISAVSRIDISGPIDAQVFSMVASGHDLYAVPGGRDNSYVPLFNVAHVYSFNNVSWGSFTEPAGIHDYVTVAVDPADPARVYAGSWGSGLVEFYNGQPVATYNESNSTLRHHTASGPNDIRVGGTAFDDQGNLWVVNSHNNNCLSRKSGSNWTGYNISAVNESDLAQLMIDKNNQKWIIMRYGTMNPYSILVFSEEGNKTRRLNASPGTGGIPGNTVYSMAVDKEGQVWVGTEKGIGVFYSPEDILTSTPSDAQQILVQVGSHTQYLMENEMVTAIAVDGANRKWIGTDRGGIFLVSADGTKEIQHFTEDNSPLFSNRITAIAISPETGEVFIGTDKGMISYKSTATEGGETNEHVYAYPNPVKENFEGFIAIKGLVTNAEVRITDVSGSLIYSTRAEGGQAIWDGKNFNGEKAKTGVYLVFANKGDGTEKVVTKILIIN